MVIDNTDLLVCPLCRSSVKFESNNLVCLNCNKIYPIENEIGILVPNPVEHLNFIESQIKSEKKDWYVSDQIEAYDKGPYRFHLKKRIDFVEKFIQSHLKQIDNNKIILDMGCGDGVNLRWLSKYSQNLLAIDYNLLRLRRTRQLMRTLKVSAKLFLADIFYIPFANDSFDLIFFNHVIEHLNDDFLALKNIYRITKKGGIVILGTPNEGALSWGFAYWIEPMTRKKTDHVHFYTAKSISELALKAGFTIKHIEYMGWGIPIWSLDSRIRKYKIIDDLFELIGKRLFKSQSTSLYIILEKPI